MNRRPIAAIRVLASHVSAAVALVLLLFVLPSSATAQVSGRVIDEEGAPVTGATVELWSSTARLGAVLSGHGGGFSFPADAADDAVGVLAYRIGMNAAQVAIGAGGSELVLRLSSSAIALDPVMVTASRPTRLCPNRDDPAARTMWDAARSRYGGPPGAHQVHIVFEELTGEVPRAGIGSAGEEPFRRGSQSTRLSFGRGWNDRVHCGYGCRIEQSFDPAYALWRYLPLESHYTNHFLTDYFGERHTFSLAPHGGDESLLVFCSTEQRSRIRADGTLRFSDGALVEARWSFRTPRPAEEAGGEVLFVPTAAFSEDVLLLPARGLFWRRIHGTGDRYFQRITRFGEWRLTAIED